jgi:O-antigen/teichoic acid export membrane protein
MSEQQSSYRQIIKATSLFGGVQAFGIVVSVIRSKFVAVLLGTAGMGINGLLLSTTNFISSITNFGLGTSAIKNVSSAAASGDDIQVSKVVRVVRRLVWITGLFGMIMMAALSPWLSIITFGNRDYTIAFILISLTLLLNQIFSGQMVLLQGLRKLKYLAKANIIGLVVGLLITIPVYYFWRLDGIVPVMIITSVTGVGLSWLFARKVKIKPVTITSNETLVVGKDILKLGFVLSLNGMIVSLVSYLVRIYISNTGGINQVGLYNAGFSIINTYVGMVFTAMGTDYYPRLSAVSNDNKSSRILINQQAEIAILILAPILAVFLVFIKWVVMLLYSVEFVAINDMIHWAMIGIFFKAASWSIAFSIIARGANKLFLWNEILANSYTLLFNIIGYRLAGLEGLGISFLVAYIVYFIQVFIVTRHKYSFNFESAFFKIAGFQILLALLCFGIMRLLIAPWSYIIGSLVILLSALYSLRELEKRIALKEIILKKFKDIRNR